MNNQTLWNSFLEKIKSEISSVAFETWFSETELYDLKDNIATVVVPMHIHKKSLTENYNDIIEEIFTQVSDSNFKFEYLTKEEIRTNIQIEDTNSNTNIVSFESNLNPHYTFDNFIVGESNKFAKTSAFAVAEYPGTIYNPLFIYGNSGLGKTHLMHAIGNYVAKSSNKRVLYVTCDKFIEDFTGIHKKDNDVTNYEKQDVFKDKYRNVDVLMIDDIQYLGNMAKTQQEFFNTFNDLYTNKKQIILTSDRSPDDLKLLEDRLKTRFTWGLTIDIHIPDFKLRMSIIDKKLEKHILVDNFPLDVKEFIASNCISDIRKLEGAITRVIAYATMMNGSEITIELAREALKDFFTKSILSKNKIDQVQQIVCKHYNISIDDIKSKKRVSSISYPRQIAMYICRINFEETLPKIGIEFGGKDHTTVMHSVEKIKKELKINSNLTIEINKIINELN